MVYTVDRIEDNIVEDSCQKIRCNSIDYYSISDRQSLWTKLIVN